MSNEKKKKEDRLSSRKKEDNKPKIGDSKPAPTQENRKKSSESQQKSKSQKRERKRKNMKPFSPSKLEHVEGIGDQAHRTREKPGRDLSNEEGGVDGQGHEERLSLSHPGSGVLTVSD